MAEVKGIDLSQFPPEHFGLSIESRFLDALSELSMLLFSWNSLYWDRHSHYEPLQDTTFERKMSAIPEWSLSKHDLKSMLNKLGDLDDEFWKLVKFVLGKKSWSDSRKVQNAIVCIAENVDANIGAFTTDVCERILFGTEKTASVHREVLHVLFIIAYAFEVGYDQAVQDLRLSHAHHKRFVIPARLLVSSMSF